MPRVDSIAIKGLKRHINDGVNAQNGYGYDDFVRMITVVRRPSYSSIGNLFNKDGQTIKKWHERYIYEREQDRESTIGKSKN